MSVRTAVEELCIRFPRNKKFSLLAGQSIKDGVRRNNVPNARGVYVIFRNDDLDRPLYIGKAGTLEQGGSWKDQGLAKRLTMKQGRIYREQFFKEFMAQHSIAELVIQWIVTHEEDRGMLPALAEVTLLQAHYDQYGCLPELNACI